MRQGVNIYKDPRKMAVDTDDMDDSEYLPQITLQEMLEDLNLEGQPDT